MSDNTPAYDPQVLRLNISKAVHPSQGISESNADFVLKTVRPIVSPDP